MVDRGIHHGKDAGSTGASDEEARLFAASFRSFLEWVHSEGAATRNHNEVVRLITDFLGTDGPTQSVVGRVLPPFEHVNLQTALDAWSAEQGRSVAVHASPSRRITAPSACNSW